jgi:Tfp pilus assembly protein PilF
MASNILSQLEQFYQDEPEDPFNVYALALEYQKHDQAKACKLFDELLKKHPLYIPSYYHAAKLFETLGLRDKVISTYETGISRAKEANDLKTARELKSAYDEFMFE